MQTAALVGWSGNGELGDLERTMSSKLGLGEGAITKRAGSLIVQDKDPVAVARKLAYLPGVSWIAAGYEFERPEESMSRLQLLAGKYLRGGSSFKLAAAVERSDREEGDILLDGNGAVLKSVKGTRVDEKNPDVKFRIVMASNRGVAGVEIREGPGGVPTARNSKAALLVSGGYHSAVTAWMAALSGYSVTLVHARSDDESLRQVARLYAELSRRVDPSSLKLRVLDGVGAAGERLEEWLDTATGPTMAGIHPQCRGGRARTVLKGHPDVLAPLLLLQEDEVKMKLESLGLKVRRGDEAPTLSITGRKSPYVIRSYGGRESDINQTLDGLLS